MKTWLRYFEFFRRDPRRDIDDEIATHLELRAADLRAQGLSAEAANARAHREFGDATAARNAALRVDERMMRRQRRAEWLETMSRDARVALRSMRSTPGYAVAATLCAAAGIGVTTAIVSASYSILLRPLPYRDSNRLVAIYAENTEQGFKATNISYPDFASWRDNNRAFSGIAIWSWSTKTLAGDASDDAERLQGADVSWNLFPILGVSPVLGRNFLQEEDAPGRHFEVIISHGLWERRFAGDRNIIGKTTQLDGRAWTVIGVMPPGFHFPDRGDYWVPFAAGPDELRQNRMYAGAIGRLKPGVTLEQAREDLHRIDADLQARFPDENRAWRADLVSLRDDLVGSLRQPLKVLLAAAGLVLLLACINVANLALARGAARSREIAIRGAIGASRSRLVAQLMTESLVIATVGGVLGVAIAWILLRGFAFAFPGGIPFYITLGLDGAALLFVAGITVLTAILFGTMPAIRGSRVDLNSALRDGARGGGAGVDKARLRSALVIGEVALSAILLTGALLLMRTYRNLLESPLGFTPSGVLTARITLPRNAGYPTLTDVQRFYDRLLERVRANPNVANAGTAQGTPMSGWDVQGDVNIEGRPRRREEAIVVHFQNVTPEYFKTIGTPLVRGRWLNETDRDSLNPSVLVTQQLVNKAFKGEDPIGKHVKIGEGRDPWATIVGVIGDLRQYRLPQPAPPAVYYSDAWWPSRQMTVAVRVKQGDPHAVVPALRSAVREIDPGVALYQIQTLDESVERSLWRQHLMGRILVIFSALALTMACLGLYGVVSYAVANRTRELGVRLALGATRASVLRLVLGHGTRLVLIGIATGLMAAWFATRILATMLYGVEPTDPLTFGIVAVSLAGVALVATAIPSRRATRVDPIVAMRAE